jgi:predicted Zn-dependent protease
MALLCSSLVVLPSAQAQETATKQPMRQAPAAIDPGASIALPALGESSGQDFSPAAERKLGDRIMRSILSDPDVIDDPMVLEYLDTLWQSLLQSARQRGDITAELDQSHAWEPFLVRDRTVNAFALPGGYIGVHLGLIAMTSTPDELASVLAHELSHVTQRHIARMIGQQARTSWVGIASLLLGVIAASRNPAAAQALVYGGQAVAIQGQLNFSRDMEREADRVGFGVLSDAGYDPGGMALMFEHLQQASRLNDDGSFPYLRTHPLTTERIGDARSRLGVGGWDAARMALRIGPGTSGLVAWHALMAGRSRVLMDTRAIAIENLMALTPKADSPPLTAAATHYTRAVALLRTGALPKAQQALDDARNAGKSLPPEQKAVLQRVLALTLADGQIQARQADAAAAAAALITLAGETKPSSAAAATAHVDGKVPQAPRAMVNSVVRLQARPELLLVARIALALPEPPNREHVLSNAATNLQTHLSVHAHDATAWSLLSSLWQRLNQPIRSVRADAEAAAAVGDLPGAIDRVLGAQKRFRQPDTASIVELSVMDSRLRTWQRQWHDDMREDGGR